MPSGARRRATGLSEGWTERQSLFWRAVGASVSVAGSRRGGIIDTILTVRIRTAENTAKQRGGSLATAREIQARFAASLEADGWAVEWEAPVEYLHHYMDNGRSPELRNGRIGLVASRDGRTIAYELDWDDPRRKSREKLACFERDEAWIVCKLNRRVRVK